MAFIWFFMPNDGISLVTQWFYNKVVNVSVIGYKGQIFGLRIGRTMLWLMFVFLLQIMLHLPYSRKLEAEADEVGLQLVAKVAL